MRQVCSVDGCGAVVKGHGYCDKHYQRLKRHGSVENKGANHVPPLERFWLYVDKGGMDGCWEWTGVHMANGYGRLFMGGRGGKLVGAHRFSCELHHGPPPTPRAVAMHSCDNPGCVNPAHLSWGTYRQNTTDAYTRDRKVSPFKKGERHHMATLNPTKVRFIRANPDMRPRDLVALLGCTRGAIDAVRKGLTWKHVSDTE